MADVGHEETLKFDPDSSPIVSLKVGQDFRSAPGGCIGSVVHSIVFSNSWGEKMGMYEDLLSQKGRGTPFDKLAVLSDAEITSGSCGLDLPNDYVCFLSEIGAGELGNAQYMLYGALVEPFEIYGGISFDLDGVLLFGDDLMGFNNGFRVSDWSVVEVDPTSKEIFDIATSFDVFIRRRILQII